ncbi:hypothetical protein RW71_04416 [Escherichia coli]|uniref:hypothetical protein n=1 Tax=Escherichia coli TaxID=562 RepID=UPI000B943900|nr:hypothetical protein [Escherichia coli]OXZ49387.1 hypothetical protein RW71_04416 [Escherichia coli]OXZ81336.1 hypothetical protein RW72_04484 [Escherichia coli]
MDSFPYEENALCDMTNFIDQEIYVLAVRSSFKSEYEKIINLAEYTKEALQPVKDEFYDESEYEEIIEIVVDVIGTGGALNVLQDEINHYLESRFRIHQEECDDVEFIQKIENMKLKTISCVSSIYKAYEGISFSFNHQYPPYVFCLDNNYLFALLYYYNKEYLPKRKEFKGGGEIITTHAPYKIMRRYSYSRYRARHITHEVDVPNNTLKKSIENGNFKLNIANENDPLMIGCAFLLGFKDTKSVAYTNELRISIDTSSPLDDFEVDKILAMIRCDLSNVQRNNKYSEYRISQDIKDLERAMDIPDISTDNYVAIKKLHAPKIAKLKTELNAKNYLCGLIILNRYLFENSASNASLEKLCDDLSEELVESIKLDDSKFSSDTIIRGYKQVRKLFQDQIQRLQ